MNLTFGNISLRPLQENDLPELLAIANDPQIWQFQFCSMHEPKVFKAKWFDKALHAQGVGERVPLVIIQQGNMVGSSSFYEIDLEHKRATIGYTWFNPSVWGSAVNPMVKLVMLDYGFNNMQFNRIAFTVDSENLRSCRAMEKLGAHFEGVLRNHMVRADGTLRHTVYYSFIRDEWPERRQQILQSIHQKHQV